jgi:hypothetical protein
MKEKTAMKRLMCAATLFTLFALSAPIAAWAADPDWKAVEQALGKSGQMQHRVDVTAIHTHALMDMPRLFYMHFWANDDPVKLAQALKAALDQTNSRK